MSRKQKLSLNETAKKGSKKDVKLQQKRHQLPEKLENCLAFFPPRGPGTTIFMVVLEPSHIMTNIASQLLTKTQKCQKCVFWGSTLFVSKALEPKSVGGFNQGLQLARRVRFWIWSIPFKGHGWASFFPHSSLVPLKRLQEKDAMVV